MPKRKKYENVDECPISSDKLYFNGNGKDFFRWMITATTEKDREELKKLLDVKKKNLTFTQAMNLVGFMLRNPSDIGIEFILSNALKPIVSNDNLLNQIMYNVMDTLDDIKNSIESQGVNPSEAPIPSIVWAKVLAKAKEVRDEYYNGVHEIEDDENFEIYVQSIIQKLFDLSKVATMYSLSWPFQKRFEEKTFKEKIDEAFEKNIMKEVSKEIYDHFPTNERKLQLFENAKAETKVQYIKELKQEQHRINELLEELDSPKSISDTLVDNLKQKGYSI